MAARWDGGGDREQLGMKDAMKMLLVVGLWWGLVTFRLPPEEQPSSGSGGVDVACTRPLIDVVWGFLVTLAALAVACWSPGKSHAKSKSAHLESVVLAGVLAPLTSLAGDLRVSGTCVAMMRTCSKFLRTGTGQPSSESPWKTLFVTLLLPWVESPLKNIRLLASCDVIVYISKRSPILTNKNFVSMALKQKLVKDEREAMVIGDPEGGAVEREARARGEENGGHGATRAVETDASGDSAVDVAEDEALGELGEPYERRELSDKGKMVLELAKVLPDYEHLKFVRGKLSVAMVVIAMQAVGYIYAVVYRSAVGVRVAPLEVVGLVLNVVLMIKGIIFSMCNRCHRPLVVYIKKRQEEELITFLSKLDNLELIGFDPNTVNNWALGIMSIVGVFLGGIIFYYINSIIMHMNIRVVIPLIIFMIALFLNLIILYIIPNDIMNLDKYTYKPAKWKKLFVILVAMTHFHVYNRVLEESLYFDGKPQHSNIHALPNLAQIFPSIG